MRIVPPSTAHAMIMYRFVLFPPPPSSSGSGVVVAAGILVSSAITSIDTIPWFVVSSDWVAKTASCSDIERKIRATKIILSPDKVSGEFMLVQSCVGGSLSSMTSTSIPTCGVGFDLASSAAMILSVKYVLIFSTRASSSSVHVWSSVSCIVMRHFKSDRKACPEEGRHWKQRKRNADANATKAARLTIVSETKLQPNDHA
mmetsp:Transcript_8641/g.19782  ORF Transcript_8641/g.19782 Transcript_8641/m.19782 type:complete len:201 (-) Transcript_8641:72-674(-)